MKDLIKNNLKKYSIYDILYLLEAINRILFLIFTLFFHYSIQAWIIFIPNSPGIYAPVAQMVRATDF